MQNKIWIAALSALSMAGLSGCQEMSGLFDDNRDTYYYDTAHSAKTTNHVDTKVNAVKSKKMISSTPEVAAPKATTVTTSAPRKGNGVPLSGPVVPQTAPTVGE